MEENTEVQTGFETRPKSRAWRWTDLGSKLRQGDLLITKLMPGGVTGTGQQATSEQPGKAFCREGSLVWEPTSHLSLSDSFRSCRYGIKGPQGDAEISH